MLDRQTEALYYPQSLLQTQPIRSVLCIAPHPDDEIFGCGGLLALLAKQGSHVHTLVLSQGEQGALDSTPDLGSQRMQESQRAATILNLPAPEFADFPDRGLVYAEPLIARIRQALETFQPQYLLLPALSEPHPDHQALALAGTAAAQRSNHTGTLLFYEVGAPLHPNCYLDITSVASLKWQAVQAFVSQLGVQSYEDHARAFARMRAYGLGSTCTAAEAFFQVSVEVLRQQGPAAALPHWPMVRAQQQRANSTQQLPLVSVLIRSVDRPQLAQAVASVAAQTYSHIEVIVLNASGHPHSAAPYPPHRLDLHLIDPIQPCARSRAANLALDAAHGEIALFLDDDDLLDPTHIERLVDALASHPRAVAAYAGVRVEADNGTFVRNYDLPWSRYRLNGINFLPIHAVAFRLPTVRQASLHLDENLPVLEDWDFWRRLAHLGDMVHCPGVSALYRQGHGESGLGNPEHANYWKTWHTRLMDRFVADHKPGEISQTLAWHAIELDRTQLSREMLQTEVTQLQQTTQSHLLQLADLHLGLQNSEDKLQQFSAESHAALQAKQQLIDRISLESQAALQAKQQVIEHFSLESQAALQAKQQDIERISLESQAALQAKQDLIESFSRETQAALDAKQALLERFSQETQTALQSQQRAMEALAADSQAEVAALQAQLLALQEQRAQIESTITLAQGELRNVRASISWRITAPLRRFNQWIAGR